MLLDNILSAGGSPLLEGPGTISAQQAHDKAIAEYRKYQQRTLTPVEQAYIAKLQQEASGLLCRLQQNDTPHAPIPPFGREECSKPVLSEVEV